MMGKGAIDSKKFNKQTSANGVWKINIIQRKNKIIWKICVLVLSAKPLFLGSV